MPSTSVPCSPKCLAGVAMRLTLWTRLRLFSCPISDIVDDTSLACALIERVHWTRPAVRGIRRWAPSAAVLILVVASCGSDSPAPVSLDGYVSAMQVINLRTVAEADTVEISDGYPLGGDLVGATELYTTFENRLSGWRSLAPPSEFADLHDALLDAVEALQEVVGDYLMDEALDGDFDFSELGPKVQPELDAAARACRDLQSSLTSAGAGLIFSDCEF